VLCIVSCSTRTQKYLEVSLEELQCIFKSLPTLSRSYAPGDSEASSTLELLSHIELMVHQCIDDPLLVDTITVGMDKPTNEVTICSSLLHIINFTT